MRPGGGGRFAAMVASGKSPALAAYIGRKKYGKTKMAKFSSQGRKRASHMSSNAHHSASSYEANMKNINTHRWAGGMIDQSYTKNQ